MEALAALFTSAAAGGATAGTVAGTIGPTAGFASNAATLAGGAASAASAGAAGGFLGSLSGWFSVAEGISGLFQGFAEADALSTQAAYEDVRAKGELLRGRREALEIAEALNETIANNAVATAASGISTEGSPAEAARAASEKADFETGITRTNAQINAAARSAQADAYRGEATGAIFGGIASAARAGGRYLLREERRGGK